MRVLSLGSWQTILMSSSKLKALSSNLPYNFTHHVFGFWIALSTCVLQYGDTTLLAMITTTVFRGLCFSLALSFSLYKIWYWHFRNMSIMYYSDIGLQNISLTNILIKGLLLQILHQQQQQQLLLLILVLLLLLWLLMLLLLLLLLLSLPCLPSLLLIKIMLT